MAKVPMKRIEIAAMLEDRKQIIELLQQRGIMEINDYPENVEKLDTGTFVSRFDKRITIAENAKAILNKYAQYADLKKPKFSFLRDKLEIEKNDFEMEVKKRDQYLNICNELADLDKKIDENIASIARAETLNDSLAIWRDLDVSMKTKGTKFTSMFIGTFNRQLTRQEILTDIATKNPTLEAIDVNVVSSFKDQTCAVVICHKEISEFVGLTLREIGFVLVSDQDDVQPKVKIRQHLKQIEKHNKEIDESKNRIIALTKHIEKIEFTIDYYSLRRDKYAELSKLGLTRKTFIIFGYIPEDDVTECVEELKDKFSLAISIDAPDDNAPVLLKNNGFAAPVEGVTKMYSLPGKNDVDPSSVMAFFYYLFFGMMLSDAGYGVLVVIGTAIALKKFSLGEEMQKTLKMFFYGGLSTVFWGAMFGSWFGDIIPTIYVHFLNKEAPNIAIWFDPISAPIKFLMAAFILGIIHLFVGQAVSSKMSWNAGNKLDAILDLIPTYLLVLGAAPLAANVLIEVPQVVLDISSYMAIGGLILVVLTAGRKAKNIFAKLGLGLYGLYNIASGYLSDILSYSRLLALGLATGSIASVVNMIGVMPSNPYAKAVLLIVVFIIGHPINMAINMLGAYVHTNRLQFVEFFSKFYEGGGRAFEPFKANTKYIKFKEDN